MKSRDRSNYGEEVYLSGREKLMRELLQSEVRAKVFWSSGIGGRRRVMDQDWPFVKAFLLRPCLRQIGKVLRQLFGKDTLSRRTHFIYGPSELKYHRQLSLSLLNLHRSLCRPFQVELMRSVMARHLPLNHWCSRFS